MGDTEGDGEESAGTGDVFAAVAAELEQRVSDWNEVQAGEQYVAQRKVLDRVSADFIEGIRAANFAFTRYPDADEWLLHRFTDDFLESAIAIRALAEQGVFNVCRRELRYLLEAAVKHVYVDQQVAGSASLADRLAFLGDTKKVPRSSVDPVKQLTVRMLRDTSSLTNAVRNAFGALSGYTHLSKKQLEERLQHASHGEYSGFESAATLDAFNRLLVQVYDVVLALVFEGIGPSFTGDLFIHVFDDLPKWRFHRGKLVGEISRFFDYKLCDATRRTRTSGIAAVGALDSVRPCRCRGAR
jgi:hypothetical protein